MKISSFRLYKHMHTKACCNVFLVWAKTNSFQVTEIRPMAPLQNRGPLEDIRGQDFKFFGKERNY